MSLDVSPKLLAEAEAGDIREADFVDTVRTSLPYAYELVDSLATQLHAGIGEFTDNQIPPASEQERGQLLRAMASDAIRGSLERHFNITLAFQNCHRVAAVRPGARDGQSYARFT
jgi:hypothetical protein